MKHLKSIFTLALTLLFCGVLYTQNITNTLGTGGTFTIKHGTTDFFTLSQSTGNVSLFRNMELGGITNSTSTRGVITKNGMRFMHNYQAPGTDGFNTFIGLEAGNFTMSGSLSIEASNNTGVGYRSLFSLTAGRENSAFGSWSLYSNTTGSWNSAFGYYSLLSNTTGYQNSAFGYYSLYSNTTGFHNSAFGYVSLKSNTTGGQNSAFGYQPLYSNTTGNSNSAFGSYSLYSNTTGSWNSAFGSYSLYSNTTGYQNSAFGNFSLYANTTGYSNSAFGYYSLLSNTTGYENSAFGNWSLYYNTTGNSNSAFGYLSLYLNTTGYENSAFGNWSLYYNTTGQRNSAFGNRALYYNSTGSNNTAIGDYAGFGANGVNFNQCTFVGANSYPTVSRSNVTMLGYGITNAQVTGDNQVCLGNTAVTQIRAQVTSITSYSDARYKVNVKDNVPGLDFILKLKPVTFNVRPTELHKIWGTPDSLVEQIDHSEAEQETRIGFIAQEVEKAAKECGFDFPGIDIPRNEKEAYTMRYVDFIMPMVKAIQELKEKSDEKDIEIAKLKGENEKLISELNNKETRISSVESQLNEIQQVVNELKEKQDDMKKVKMGESN